MSIHQPAKLFRPGVPVTLRPRPFETAVSRYVMHEGMTLAEIAANIPDLPIEFWRFGVIRVAGHEIPRANWHLVRPKVPNDGSEIAVTLHMLPAGGSGLQLIAQVGLMGLSYGAGLINPALGVLVGIGGSILLGMLFAPHQKKPDVPRESISYGVSGNPAKPLEQLERVLGKVQSSPPYLANPYTILDNQNVFVYAVVGYCGNHEITEVELNGSGIDDDETVVEYETREGYSSDTPITVAPKSAFEERPNLRLSEFDLNPKHDARLNDQAHPERCDPTWHSLSGRGEGNLYLRFLFPSGLFKAHVDNSDIDAAGVPLRLQFRRHGSTTWINGPEFHFQDHSKLSQEIRVQIALIFEANTVEAAPDLDYYAWVAYFRASAGETWEWTADAYFDTGSGNYANHVEQDRNGFNVYLDPLVFPPGEYECRVKRGYAYNNNFFSPSAYTVAGSAFEASFFEYHLITGIYAIALPEQSEFSQQCVVDAVTTISDDYPLPAATEVPLTLIAVKLKNGTINSLSATFQSRVNTWNGVNWTTYEPSQNPAALYRHVLKDTDLNAKPLDASIIDDASIQVWYTDCVTNGRECNFIAADSVENVLKQIGTAGWAVPRQNEKWGVIFEHDRSGESITQNFTPLNSRGFTTLKSFADIPHAIYAEFHDETREFTTKSLTVYGDGYNSTNATLFQQLSYGPITDPDQIDLRALMDWRQMRYRQTRRQIEVAAESLISDRGDLVGLTHDVVGTKYFYGLVDAVLTSGANVTGLRLEALAEISAAAGAIGAMVRYEDGSILEAPINETTDTSVITFTTPFAIPASGVLCEGCLVALGLVGQIYKRMLIADIRPTRDFGAKLTLIDEAPEIFASSGFSLDFSQAKNSQYIPLAA